MSTRAPKRAPERLKDRLVSPALTPGLSVDLPQFDLAPHLPDLPLASFPDLAAQIVPCLEDLGDLGVPAPTPEQIDTIKAGIRTALNDNDADVRYACIGGASRFGIWLDPPASAADSTLRDLGLTQLDVLPGITQPLSFALHINARLIRSRVQAAFDAAPKRYNVKGKPDPNGKINLTAIAIRFDAEPDAIISTIEGFHDGGILGETPFTVTVRDELSGNGQEIDVDTTTDVEIADGGLRRLFTGSLILTILSPFFALGGLIAWGGLLAVQLIENAAEDKNAVPGAGGSLAALFPAEIMIPGGKKLVLFYSRTGALEDVSIDGSGLTVRGITLPTDRQPRLAIDGPPSAIAGGDTATLTYAIRTADLRSPLRIAWTATSAVVERPTRSRTAVRFDLSALQPGDVVAADLRVTVTDADDLTASATKRVTVQLADFPPPPDDPDDLDPKPDPVMPERP